MKQIILNPLFHPALLVFIIGFLCSAIIFHPETGWNVNTRLNLVYAVVDQGTLRIDFYHDLAPYQTGDKAFFEDHFYSDKIFGVSLLALPFYAVGHLSAGGPLSFTAGHALMKTGAVALPAGIGLALFFLLLARLGAPPRRAVILTILGFFGTTWFGYATVFYPYIPGMTSLLAALYLTLYPPAQRLTAVNSFVIGLLTGYTLLCDLLFGLAVLGVGTVWLLRLLDQVGIIGLRAFAEMTGERSRLKQLIIYSITYWLGVLIPLSLFFIYTYSIFGRLAIPYEYEWDPNFREGMAQGFMGATTPKLTVLYYITVHPFRGVFFWSPILIAALAGCIAATRQYGKRCIIAWLGIYTFAVYLLFNSAYYMWWGGWSMGSRFLLPALPFMLLGLGELARIDKLSIFAQKQKLARPAWITTILLGALSVALILPVSLWDPQIPQSNPDADLKEITFASQPYIPHFFALSRFYSGAVNINPITRANRWQQARELGGAGPPLLQARIWNESEKTALNLLYIALFFGFAAACTVAARHLAPEKIKGTDRYDFPFRTIDGTAAPLPAEGNRD